MGIIHHFLLCQRVCNIGVRGGPRTGYLIPGRDGDGDPDPAKNSSAAAAVAHPPIIDEKSLKYQKRAFKKYGDVIVGG